MSAVLLRFQMLQMESHVSRWTSIELDAPPGVAANRTLFSMKTLLHLPSDFIVTTQCLIVKLKPVGSIGGDPLLSPSD
jgi:hypothetical protein